MLRDFIPLNSVNPNYKSFYIRELLYEKQKQLLEQLSQLKNPDKTQFVLDKITTIQKLLQYEENNNRTYLNCS